MTVSEEAPQGKKRHIARNIFVVGCIVVVVIIFCSFASLVLLGPQIGNVFSQITFALEDTPSTIIGEGYRFDYPGNWQLMETEQFPFCLDPEVECLFIAAVSSDGSNLSMMRYALLQPAEIGEVDAELWAEFIGQTPDAVLDSRTEITVSGHPAVQRIFYMPAPDTEEGEAHLMQVYVLDGQDLYQFTLWTPGEESLDTYKPIVEDFLYSAAFTSK